MGTKLVITAWGGEHEDLLERCKDSVKEAGVEHQIVRCGPDFAHTMFKMRNDADMVAWVDSDDIVYPGAIQSSFALLEATGKGLVYTDEAYIDRDDVVLQQVTGERSIHALCSHPAPVHHLTCTKKYSIGGRVKAFDKKFNHLMEWAMRVDCVANAGMVRNPMIGYGWRMHTNQMTTRLGFQAEMADLLPGMRTEFRSWFPVQSVH